MKRGYLLPEGCKDLIDVLNQAKQLSSLHPLFIDLSKLGQVVKLAHLKPRLFKFKPTEPMW